jgi:hypothetical protein
VRFKGLFHAISDGAGHFVTAGVLLSGPRHLAFHPAPGMESFGVDFNQKLSESLLHMETGDVFRYYEDRGNGVTAEWSLAEPIEASSPEQAAAKLLASSNS